MYDSNGPIIERRDTGRKVPKCGTFPPSVLHRTAAMLHCRRVKSSKNPPNSVSKSKLWKNTKSKTFYEAATRFFILHIFRFFCFKFWLNMTEEDSLLDLVDFWWGQSVATSGTDSRSSFIPAMWTTEKMKKTTFSLQADRMWTIFKASLWRKCYEFFNFFLFWVSRSRLVVEKYLQQ